VALDKSNLNSFDYPTLITDMENAKQAAISLAVGNGVYTPEEICQFLDKVTTLLQYAKVALDAPAILGGWGCKLGYLQLHILILLCLPSAFSSLPFLPQVNHKCLVIGLLKELGTDGSVIAGVTKHNITDLRSFLQNPGTALQLPSSLHRQFTEANDLWLSNVECLRTFVSQYLLLYLHRVDQIVAKEPIMTDPTPLTRFTAEDHLNKRWPNPIKQGIVTAIPQINPNYSFPMDKNNYNGNPDETHDEKGACTKHYLSGTNSHSTGKSMGKW